MPATGSIPSIRICTLSICFMIIPEAKEECERFLDRHFDVVNLSKIPMRKTPADHRRAADLAVFCHAAATPSWQDSQLDEQEFVARVRHPDQHAASSGAYVFSSGKNMGVFKAVGYPEDVGEFYRLEEYEGYCWTAHGRYPDQHARLVGRRPSLCPAGLSPSCTTARSPPTTPTAGYIEMYGYQMHPADRYRGHHLYDRLSWCASRA